MKKDKVGLKLFYNESILEAGCDEAGRGCLAGPVFAAAVILPKQCDIQGLTDSKLLSEKERYRLRDIIQNTAIAWAVAKIDVDEIEKTNILKAAIRAMHVSVSQLSVKPDFLLIDGNQFLKYPNIPHKCIVKGDSTYLNIAAASVLAKTYRDDFMNILHQEYPQYMWVKNKGYGTAVHRNAIAQFGITTHHRRTFRLLPDPELPLFK